MENDYLTYIKEHNLGGMISIAGFTDILPAQVGAADCLISSSDEESFGITIVEALAAGVRVISTDAPYGPREILADGKYGRLVPVGDVDAMASAIIDCIDGKIPIAPDESWQRYTLAAIEKRYAEALQISINQ